MLDVGVMLGGRGFRVKMDPSLPPPPPRPPQHPPPYIKKRNWAMRKMHKEKNSGAKIKNRQKSRFVKMNHVRKGENGENGRAWEMGKSRNHQKPMGING